MKQINIPDPLDTKYMPDWMRQNDNFRYAYSTKPVEVKSVVPLACEKE